MKTIRQPENAALQAAVCWPQAAVLAMNLRLLTHPVQDMQEWFEQQVVLHLGCSPHGSQLDSSVIA